MAIVAKIAGAGLSGVITPNQVCGAGLVCGEAVKRLDACYVKQSDGKVYRSIATATASDETNQVRFLATDDFAAGEDFSGFLGSFEALYCSGATNGINLFLATGANNEGKLADNVTAGAPLPIAFVLKGGAYIRTKNL